MPPEIENEGQDPSGTASETPEAQDTEISDSQGSEDEQLEAESDEQALDAQDTEEEENEEGQPEAAKTPKEKSGNFDWKKINEKLGNGEVQKAFTESQRTISRYSQENKTLKEKVTGFDQTIAPLKEKAEMYDWFDNVVRENPALRSQIQAIVAGTQPAAGAQSGQQMALPPGVNPEDPLAPLVIQLQQGYQQLAQQSQQAMAQQRQNQIQNTFRQGLVEAKAAFESTVGRKPTESELKLVAERMRQTNHLKGADWVPSLFLKEIQKREVAKLHESRKQKKALPKSLNSGAPSKTSKSKSEWEAFNEAWEKEYGDRG